MGKAPEDMSSGRVACAAGTWGPRAVTDYLDREGWHYEFVPHKPVVASAGDHRHAVVLIPDELLRRGRSTPANIIEE